MQDCICYHPPVVLLLPSIIPFIIMNLDITPTPEHYNIHSSGGNASPSPIIMLISVRMAHAPGLASETSHREPPLPITERRVVTHLLSSRVSVHVCAAEYMIYMPGPTRIFSVLLHHLTPCHKIDAFLLSAPSPADVMSTCRIEKPYCITMLCLHLPPPKAPQASSSPAWLKEPRP